jgi:hypothetical protein
VARYPGRNGVIYLATSASGTASTVIALTTWTLDQATDKIEVTAFGDSNKTYVQGLKDLKGTFSGFWDDTETKVFSGADSSDGVKLYLYPSSNKTGSYFYGTAWLDASMNTNVNGAVAISGSFAAASSWGRVAI